MHICHDTITSIFNRNCLGQSKIHGIGRGVPNVQSYVQRRFGWLVGCIIFLRPILGHFERGQLVYPHCSRASLLGNLPVLSAHSFACGRERMVVDCLFHYQISTKECAGHEDRTRERLLTELARPASKTILRKSHHWPCIGKRQNFYRTEWQTVIKVRVTSFILALALLCEQPFNYWNMIFVVSIVSFCSYFNKIVSLRLTLCCCENV